MPRGHPPRQLELAIIGAGPAGLAAAQAASSLSPVVFEAGRDVDNRDQTNPSDLVTGVGGAGLYSDGKFSFWPSATHLWNLRRHFVEQAYEWLATESAAAGISVPPLQLHDGGSCGQVEKLYPSLYATADARHALIRRLSLAVNLRLQQRITDLSYLGDAWRLTAGGNAYEARSVILASGRFGPLLLADGRAALAMRPLRLEVGARIEQHSETFFLRDHESLDPKYIWRHEQRQLEWRTFCCCRDGRVEITDFSGTLSVSGRADCPPSGLSNVGFNVRILDEPSIRRLWPSLHRNIQSLEGSVRSGFQDFMRPPRARGNRLAQVLGGELADDLRLGLEMLVEHFPDADFGTSELVGPTIEGVGLYPVHDETLQTSVSTMHVVGDATGSFRGLTAALVSGYVGGLATANREIRL